MPCIANGAPGIAARADVHISLLVRNGHERMVHGLPLPTIWCTAVMSSCVAASTAAVPPMGGRVFADATTAAVLPTGGRVFAALLAAAVPRCIPAMPSIVISFDTCRGP